MLDFIFKSNIKIIVIYFLFTNNGFANGVSPYLPLKTDPMIELELEKLATITKMPVLTKPYHATIILEYLVKIQYSHPLLFTRIHNYLKRYKKQKTITHAEISLNASSNVDKTLNNQRGQALTSNYDLSLNAFWQINEHLIINAGGRYFEGESPILNNTFISFGGNFLQVDLGYKETWLSPHHEAAILKSTQAETPFNITLSNPHLITKWNIQYHMSLALLDKMDGIKYGDEYFSGKPGYLTMSLSLQPIEGLTIAGNRTFMFGGGERNIDINDIWNAIIDPVNSDNCGGESSLQNCDEEVGNQQASISTKLDTQLFNTPISFYFEFAGEDTGGFSNTSLSNQAYHYGLFLPFLSANQALYLEYTEFEDAWYVHHLYQEGYSNNKHKMGHWWGDNKHPNDPKGGYTANIKYYKDFIDLGRLTLNYRVAKYDPSSWDDYQDIQEYQISFSHIFQQGFLDYNIYFGETAYDKNFIQTSISYRY